MAKKLELVAVNKKYKLDNKQTFQALYDISVEFDSGELISIVGESGSGKSTLMNLIGGLDSDFTGQIIADGENLSKLTEKELDKYRKNKVGFVFQSFNLISHLSILDNVTLALTLSNVSEKEKVQRATEMLRKVGLEKQLKKKPTQLSGGQKQRVAIARALINDPEIIIADEPTGALDSATSMQILETLKEIADSGKLVIMVTHSEKVASISSRVVEISDGRIVSDTINENYVKMQVKNEFEEPKEEKKSEKTGTDSKEVDTKSKQISLKKDKQNLSLISAIKLSTHNMWASRVKNFLMAFGVAIGIGSLILMMSFSSGITDYINNTMKSYSDPEIVTVTKKSESISDVLNFDKNKFTDEEIQTLYSDVNAYLEEKNIDFVVDENSTSFGFSLMTMTLPEASVADTFDLENKKQVYYLYSIPPYYSDTNVIEGSLSTPPELNSAGEIVKKGGFMFTKSIYSLFPDESPIGKEVTITIELPDETKFTFTDTICGIMDSSVMSGYLIAYIDYDYLRALFENTPGAQGLFAPTTVYINTGSEEITNEINSFLSSPDSKYSGSIEDQLAGMFSSMSSTIGTSLTIISCISLLVSAMMILVVLYMSVSERTKEIGVLKSIGARRKDIKRIFTSESFLVGVLSGVFGIIFNLILTFIAWIVLKTTLGIVPISYRWWYFFVAMGVSIVISMLSGLYPASKAAKLDPVESLRRE